MRARHRVAVLGIAVALAAGCGYVFVRPGGSLGDVHSVAIPTLRNDSWEPGAEYLFTDALRREFLRRQGVRLVEDSARADLVLRGRVRAVRSRAASVDSLVLALETELTVELELEALRPDGDKVLLDADALAESEHYLASADAEAARKNRKESLRRIAEVLAARVYLSLSESLEALAESAPQASAGSAPQASAGSAPQASAGVSTGDAPHASAGDAPDASGADAPDAQARP